MQIQKSQKLLLSVTVILVIVTFLSTFIITGCGRRARAIAALEKAGQTEEQNGQSQTESFKENEKSDAEETVKESIKDEETTEKEDNTENEGNNTTESEESVEDDEETTASESAEETFEVETTELNAKIAADLPFVAAECANIIGSRAYVDPVIYPGDNGADNLEVRGFISYDISQLSGSTIESAKISGQSLNIGGTPFDTYGPMIIKAVYWGARAVTPADFNLDGIEITNISASNFGKSPAVLKDDLQNVVNSGINRYQLCFYFEMPQTDGDSQSDNIQYLLEDISLTVTYSK